jgi:hypothetical protein
MVLKKKRFLLVAYGQILTKQNFHFIHKKREKKCFSSIVLEKNI